MPNMMVKLKPWQIGLLEAGGVIVYVSIFSSIAMNVQTFFPFLTRLEPMIATIGMLIVFIFSAFTCWILMFGTPLILIMKGEYSVAIHTVLWSGLYLLMSLILLIGGTALFLRFHP